MSKDSLKIALLQHTPEPNNLPAALARLEKNAASASSQDCDLLLVPEASVTGYNQPKSTMEKIALDAQGETTEAIASICREYQIAVAYGFAESHKDKYYNCVHLIDKNGQVQGKYRKTHLWGDLDRELFTAGDSFDCGFGSKLVSFNGWNIGFLICYDIEFPEASRHLTLAGADLILIPTGLMQPWREVAEQVVPVRAYENQIFIAYCNYCGNENGLQYEGRSCIAGPDGKDLARAGQTPVMQTATLERRFIDDARSALPYHRDRRPALYN